jgi:hypothetical protein
MSEKSPNRSAKGRAAKAPPTLRPTVEALEERLLLSFSWGAGRVPDVVQNQPQQAAPLIDLHSFTFGAAVTQGRPTESVTLNFTTIKIESLQAMGGGTTALSYESMDAKHKNEIELQTMDGGTTALSYNLKHQKMFVETAAVAPADGTPVSSPTQTSLQAPGGGTTALILTARKAGKDPQTFLQAVDGGTTAVTVKPGYFLKIDGIGGGD